MMRRKMLRPTTFRAFLFGGVAMLGAAAVAQTDAATRFHDPNAAEAEIRACLDRAASEGESATGCIGHVAGLCQSHDANHTTHGAIRCSTAASEAWDRLLNEYYGQAREHLSEDGAAALRDAQRAWIDYRDTSCAVWLWVFEGGSLGRQITADCIRQVTAERAVDLADIAAAMNFE